jgi:hypothetical protein
MSNTTPGEQSQSEAGQESPGADKPAFKNPKPTVERISELANRVLTGDILLPKFQRDFVWPRAKVLGLLDSIALNYPIGSILLWQSKQELASERSIADLGIAQARPDYPVNYLLDGQQRLSTVCGALYWKPNDGSSLWNIVYDLRTAEFRHLTTLDDPPLSQVPMRYLAQPSLFFKRIVALDDESLRTRAEALFDRLQNYMIAAVTLGDMPINDIAPIFERINSTGTPLTIVDLMRAATWDPTFDLRDEIDGILSALGARDFHDVGRKTILRAVSAAGGFGFSVDDIDRLRSKSVDELRALVVDVLEASHRAADFLSTHVRAAGGSSLPYANQFAVLTELFRVTPSPSATHFSAIERWFWRTTLSGYFGGWNTGQMSRDFEEVRRFAADNSGSEFVVRAPLPQDDIWRLTPFRSNTAHSKMLALMMAFNDPVDLITGQRLELRKSLSWSNDREYHHFFPQSFLRVRGVPSASANSVANFILLSSASNIRISNKAPSQYLAELTSELGEAELLRRLGTVLVSEQAYRAAIVDDFGAFLAARSTTLHDRAMALVGVVGTADGIDGERIADSAAIAGSSIDVDASPREVDAAES